VSRERVLAILFGVLLVALVARAARKEGGVLERNRAFGERFLAGDDPYYDPARGKRIHGPYPPSFALAAAPLALLPELAARIAWASLQAGALVLFWRLCRARARALGETVERRASVCFALALLLASRFLLRDTAGGGGNLIFGALAWLGIERALAGASLSAGAPLALSLVLKPNLAPVLLVLAARRKWRALGATLAVAAILFLLPAASYGWTSYLGLGERWLASTADYAALDDPTRAEAVPEGMPLSEEGGNQSLRELVRRTCVAATEPGAEDVHLVALSARTAAWIARGIAFALIASAVAHALLARTRENEWLAALAFLPLALLLSPITWKAHHVVLLPVYFALVARAAEPERRPRWLIPFTCVYYAICVLASEEIVGSDVQRSLDSVGVVGVADLALLAVLWHLCTRKPGVTNHAMSQSPCSGPLP
jgi:hypothetical protein